MVGAAGWTKELTNTLEIWSRTKMVKQNAPAKVPTIYEIEQLSKESGKIIN